MKTLITFLGRVPRTENGYRTTRYQFPDGPHDRPLAFLGWALHERIRPERLVVLGTDASMWDHLFESDLKLGEEAEEQRIALIDAVERRAVSQDQLDGLAPLLCGRLGTEVRLQLIPYCRDHAEQVELLRIVSKAVETESTVHLDVTHGFRHLPMLALLAALLLRVERRAKVDGIWYAPYDPDTGQAPVYNLSGLLRIADGLEALARFDSDCDYGSFVPLLDQAGAPSKVTSALRKATFYENILNVGEATGQLRKVQGPLAEVRDRLSPDLALLLPAMEERLAWVAESKQFEKQVALARRAMRHGDYLRATLLAYEAVITRLCQMGQVDITDFEAREAERRSYEKSLHQAGRNAQERADYLLLKNLRNQVAHGTRGSTREVQHALLEEGRLRATLERLITAIEEGRLPATSSS